MKQTKRILSLVIAFVMIFCAVCPTAFAKVVSGAVDDIYTDASKKPDDYLNGVDKYEFSASEGAGYVLDLLDGILRNANLVYEDETVYSIIGIDVKLTVRFRNIDEALWTLYNVVNGIAGGNKTCLGNVLSVGSLSDGLVSTVVGWLDLGDIEDLNVDALGDQNESTTRVCRNVPNKTNTLASSDLSVLKELIQFLSDNRDILKKIATSSLDLGLLGDIDLGDTIQPFLDDFPGALKDTLYGVLIDGEADEAPSDWTYDTGVQQIVDWLLIDGTGDTAETGANSVLGAEFEAFLPAIADQPGAASLTSKQITADRDGDGVAETCTMNFYQLVSNAINALLGGMVSDLLEGVLLDALDIEATETYPYGDPSVLSDVMFSTIVGAIEQLCVACGAPAITYTDEENTYPIPKIEKLLDWFFNGGGLATFIKIDYNGIEIEDNFVSLLHKVIRILPGLFPLLGISVPDGLTYSTTEMAEQYYDENGTHTYWAYKKTDGVNTYSQTPAEVYIPDPENYPDDYAFVSNGNSVNTTDPTGADYYDPALIEDRYVLSNDQIYGALIKIVLNSLIDGCYFPEWADTIPSVGAYAVASLAAQYLPENNYFDRLDAYHYEVELGQSDYSGRVKTDAEPLAYTETLTLTATSGETKTVTIPRAAMDIGMSVVAYIIRGWNDFSSVLGYTPETDTSFEVYALEFVLWGAIKFVPVLSGKLNSSTHRVGNINGVSATFMDAINTALAGLDSLNSTYPKTNNGTVSNIPGSEAASILYTLLDNTLFQIIPVSWLPDWVEDYGSQGVIDWWLFDSVVNFDLQQLLSILQINSDGELATSDALTVIIRLIDRVLGLIVGGNSILPDANRNVFTTNTSITTLEALLGNGSNLSIVIERLIYWLNVYIGVLGDTVFPLIFLFTGSTMKSAKYYEGSELKDPIGNNQITYEQLSEYVKSVSADNNATNYSGTQYYTTKAKANTVAEDIGIKDYDADANAATIDGATKYGVEFPESYKSLSNAEKASSYIDNSEVVSERVNRVRTYYVSVKDDYRTATSPTWSDTQTTDANGNVTAHSYSYPNITRATAIYDAAKGYRTGDLGEVEFTDGYRCFDIEDYRASNIFYYNRWEDAVDDAGDLLSDIDTYAQTTLPSAYHDWLMYYVKTKLVENGIYDKNLDGTVDSNDGNPDVPSSPYPFYNSSGSTSEFNYAYDAYNPLTSGSYTRSWSYSYCSPTNIVIAEALAYANATEDDGTTHDVTFTGNEVQLIVRLALKNYTFDITADGCWSSLSDANLSTISTLCNSLGLTFDTTTHEITSKSFALFGSSLNSSSTFGKYVTWSDSTASYSDISLTPVSANTIGASGVDEVANDIQEQYVEFATKVYELTQGLNDNYDNISWRTAKCEDSICSSPNTNTLEFILSLTNDAYYPSGTETGKNKKLNEFGNVVTAYTKSSFDEFQQAYDYGVCLLNQKNAGSNLTQSIVTIAYKAILEAYKNLVPFTGKPDWTTLDNYIEQAELILQGDLGLGENVDRDLGYTLETLNNLSAATIAAEAYKSQNYEAFDSDYQEQVDEQAMILYGVIAALEFPAGLEPMAILNPDYTGSYNINEDTSYQLTEGGVQYKIITGLSEGQNFVDTFTNDGESDSIFVATGYTNDGNANKLFIDKSNFGYGTGSSINGYVKLIPRFKYYAVLFGDLNGDTRIDGADKTIVNMEVAQDSTETMEKYKQVAADVNFDGSVDQDDIAIINAYYKKTDTSGINQAGSPSTSWFNTTVSE